MGQSWLRWRQGNRVKLSGLSDCMCFPGGSVAKNLPARQDTQLQSPCRGDPPEEEIAAHFSILAWRIPRTEEPGGLPSMGSQTAGHD